ncbi:hypothetical protein F8388_011509 [Cannabis sativa]|uniref:Uncharacterized protein n=1 Tax=Cannabis sativa TaxID=3483 RepID=A0A7J6G479_CANSA|nr:hypothetical protein F8388_011509 [Cannabis sativa]
MVIYGAVTPAQTDLIKWLSRPSSISKKLLFYSYVIVYCSEDAILKFEEALLIDPLKHEAMWSLGNANTSYTFMTPNLDEAKPSFVSAYEFFQKVLEELLSTVIASSMR